MEIKEQGDDWRLIEINNYEVGGYYYSELTQSLNSNVMNGTLLISINPQCPLTKQVLKVAQKTKFSD